MSERERMVDVLDDEPVESEIPARRPYGRALVAGAILAGLVVVVGVAMLSVALWGDGADGSVVASQRTAGRSPSFDPLGTEFDPVGDVVEVVRRVEIPDGHALVRVTVRLRPAGSEPVSGTHTEIVPVELTGDPTAVAVTPERARIEAAQAPVEGVAVSVDYDLQPGEWIELVATVPLDGRMVAPAEFDAWVDRIVAANPSREPEPPGQDPPVTVPPTTVAGIPIPSADPPLLGAPPDPGTTTGDGAQGDGAQGDRAQGDRAQGDGAAGDGARGEGAGPPLSVRIEGQGTLGVGEYAVFPVSSEGVTAGAWSIGGTLDRPAVEWLPGQDIWVELRRAGEYTIRIEAWDDAGTAVADEHLVVVEP